LFLVNTQRRVGRTNFSPSRLLPIIWIGEKTKTETPSSRWGIWIETESKSETIWINKEKSDAGSDLESRRPHNGRSMQLTSWPGFIGQASKNKIQKEAQGDDEGQREQR